MPGVQIGLRDLHYAILSSDDETGAVYEAPESIVGAIQANINPNPSSETLFADDGPMETAATLGEIELEMIAASFPIEVQAVLLGHSLEGGVLVRKSTDVAPWVAIGFKSLKSNGSYKYVWLYKGKFMAPEMSHETKGDAVAFQTPTLVGRFVKRDYDDAWIKETDEDADDFVEATATNWFTDVEGTPDTTPPTVSAVDPVDDDTDVSVDAAVQWTFDEAIRTADVHSGNFILFDLDAETEVAGTLEINANKTIVTFTPDASLSGSTEYQAIVTTGVRDLAGNHLASAHITSFTTEVT